VLGVVMELEEEVRVKIAPIWRRFLPSSISPKFIIEFEQATVERFFYRREMRLFRAQPAHHALSLLGK
jgi:hypothetical protein